MRIEDYILASKKPVHPTHLAERFSVSKSKAYNVCVSLLLEGKVEEVRIKNRTFYRVRRIEPQNGQPVED
jgi:DNA-binding IclR family transcriptional regulator